MGSEADGTILAELRFYLAVSFRFHHKKAVDTLFSQLFTKCPHKGHTHLCEKG